MSRRTLALAAAGMLAACSSPSPQPAAETENRSEPAAAGEPAPPPTPAEPPAPGSPGGLPDDRTPVAEAPFAPASAQAAADIVQTYYALLEAGRLAEARRLWSGAGEASGSDEAGFAARFARYVEYHAQVGAPGTIEGAAGSSYVEVPVVLHGRLKSGEGFSRKAVVTLRRVNDVPGSTAEQRRWHIARIEESGDAGST
jgi:hypothetical protein